MSRRNRVLRKYSSKIRIVWDDVLLFGDTAADCTFDSASAAELKSD